MIKNKKRIIKLGIILVFFIFSTGCATFVAVPDESTAIQLAKTDYYNLTGEAMDKKYPLLAYLSDGIWVVTMKLPPNTFGGGPTIELERRSGKIVRRYHTQ